MAVLTDDLDLRKVFLSMAKDIDGKCYVILTEFPDENATLGSESIKQLCFKEDEDYEVSNIFNDLYKIMEEKGFNFLEDNSPKPDFGLADVHLWMYLGGNGDYYFSLFKKKDGIIETLINYRMSMSGGALSREIDIRMMFVSLYREREKKKLNLEPNEI